jgi:hypothetical protein
MGRILVRSIRRSVALLMLAALAACATTAPPPTPRMRIAGALREVLTQDQPGREGLVTAWDGNKYVQCRRLGPDLRCEAAGALMQPSLSHVLTADRIAALAALGWRLDPSFGAYVRSFPTGWDIDQTTDEILKALDRGYAADLQNLEVKAAWIAVEACPPRNGYSQNLAGMINDAPAMADVTVHACAFTPPPLKPEAPLAAASPKGGAEAVMGAYLDGAAREIHRLRGRSDKRRFTVFDTDRGYVQCEPQQDPAGVYCEAESAESWPALSSVLTPDRVLRLHEAGFADPGRTQNYSRTYPAEGMDDHAVARELLTILHEVYGFDGGGGLNLRTEAGDQGPM